MSKFQPVKFNSIEDLLCSLPTSERQVVDFLRSIVREMAPHVNEKLSYNVPFYSIHKRVAFIWPSSVPWGKVRPDGVQFGFCYGNLLHDELGWLDRGTRKQVYTKTWQHIAEIDVPMLKAYLEMAIELDSNKASKK